MNTKKKGGSFRTAGETIIAKACRTVPDFAKTYQTFERAQTLGQRSKSAIHNYGRSLAKVALHFGIDPPAAELSDVIRRYGKDFVQRCQPLGYHKGVLHALSVCRTSELGGHVDRCDDCGYIRISYNSCRNRHCPKCQQVNKERWIVAREADLLPVGYFHVVFTLPDCLNALCHKHPKELYDSAATLCKNSTLWFSVITPKVN